MRTFFSAFVLSGSVKPWAMPSASSFALVPLLYDSWTTSVTWPDASFQAHSVVPYSSSRLLRSGALTAGNTRCTSASERMLHGSPAGSSLAAGLLPVDLRMSSAVFVASFSL